MKVTVAEAAAKLGINDNAVRQRIKRKSLESVRENGRLYVILTNDDLRGTTHETDVIGVADQSRYVAEIERQNAYLRTRVESLEAQLNGLMLELLKRQIPAEPESRKKKKKKKKGKK